MSSPNGAVPVADAARLISEVRDAYVKDEITCCGLVFEALNAAEAAIAALKAEVERQRTEINDTTDVLLQKADELRDEWVRAEAELATLRADAVCAWTQWVGHDADVWESACGQSFVFIDGGPSDNGFKHCHHCGKAIDTAISARSDGDAVAFAWIETEPQATRESLESDPNFFAHSATLHTGSRKPTTRKLGNRLFPLVIGPRSDGDGGAG